MPPSHFLSIFKTFAIQPFVPKQSIKTLLANCFFDLMQLIILSIQNPIGLTITHICGK